MCPLEFPTFIAKQIITKRQAGSQNHMQRHSYLTKLIKGYKTSGREETWSTFIFESTVVNAYNNLNRKVLSYVCNTDQHLTRLLPRLCYTRLKWPSCTGGIYCIPASEWLDTAIGASAHLPLKLHAAASRQAGGGGGWQLVVKFSGFPTKWFTHNGIHSP